MWDDIHDALRDRVRQAEGRDPATTAAVLDSQSAKSACGREQIGYDAGKKVRGRKRHLLVDTCGLLLVCMVHSALVQDRAGARLVFYSIDEQYPTIGLIWLDGGYANSVDASLVDWAEYELGVRLEVVKRNDDVKRQQTATAPVGGRAYVWLADPLSPAMPGLRTHDRARRRLHQDSDDPVDGRPPGRSADPLPRHPASGGMTERCRSVTQHSFIGVAAHKV